VNETAYATVAEHWRGLFISVQTKPPTHWCYQNETMVMETLLHQLASSLLGLDSRWTTLVLLDPAFRGEEGSANARWVKEEPRDS